MKLTYMKLICALFALITLSAKAQEQLRDSTLAPKAIFDIENPRFVWAVQKSPTILCIGLTEDNYLELKENNSIWFTRKSDQESHQEARISSPLENGLILFEPEIKDINHSDTTYSYDPASGMIANSQKVLYNLAENGALTDPNGKELVIIGKDVNRKLAVFYLINFYSREMEIRNLSNNK